VSINQFAEYLMLQETINRDNFQGRYVMNHPVRDELKCAAAKGYQKQVIDRQFKEAKNLANLTGWRIDDVRRRIKPLS
jgi:hypothetical protein